MFEFSKKTFCLSPLPPQCVWGEFSVLSWWEGRVRAPLVFVVMSLVHQVADTSLACPAETCSWWLVVRLFPPVMLSESIYHLPLAVLASTLSSPWLLWMLFHSHPRPSNSGTSTGRLTSSQLGVHPVREARGIRCFSYSRFISLFSVT